MTIISSMPDATGETEPAIPSYLEVLEQVVGTIGDGELQAAVKRLLGRARSLQRLSRGWDSYGGQPPSSGTLDFALLFAAQTCVFLVRGGMPLVEPFMVATREGGVQLEWSCQSRELEIEIPRPETFRVLAVEGDQEDKGPVTAEVAFRYVRWLATGQSQ